MCVGIVGRQFLFSFFFHHCDEKEKKREKELITPPQNHRFAASLKDWDFVGVSFPFSLYFLL